MDLINSIYTIILILTLPQSSKKAYEAIFQQLLFCLQLHLLICILIQKYDFRSVFYVFAPKFQFYNICNFFNFFNFSYIYWSRKTILDKLYNVEITYSVVTISIEFVWTFEPCSSKTVGTVAISVSGNISPSVWT